MYCLHKCLTKIKIGWKYHSFVSAVWSLTSVGKQTIFYKGHIPFHPQLDAVTLWSKTPLKEPAEVVSMKLAEWNTKPENWRSWYEINAPSGAYIKFRNCIMHMVFKGTARQNTVKCRSSSMPHQGIYDRQHYDCTLTMASLMASTINVPSPWFCTLTTP